MSSSQVWKAAWEKLQRVVIWESLHQATETEIINWCKGEDVLKSSFMSDLSIARACCWQKGMDHRSQGKRGIYGVKKEQVHWLKEQCSQCNRLGKGHMVQQPDVGKTSRVHLRRQREGWVPTEVIGWTLTLSFFLPAQKAVGEIMNGK